jgi:hypothetical protein
MYAAPHRHSCYKPDELDTVIRNMSRKALQFLSTSIFRCLCDGAQTAALEIEILGKAAASAD